MVVGTFANADVKGLLIMGPDLFLQIWPGACSRGDSMKGALRGQALSLPTKIRPS